MIRLVCIDVDGTLVGRSGDVLPAIWSVTERARRHGLHLAVCSGRPAFGNTREWATRLDPDGWHVFQNGASVLHLGTGRSLSQQIPPETIAYLVSRSRKTGRILELYTDEEYAVESAAQRARDHAGLLGVPFATRAFASLGKPVVRAQWLLSRDETQVVLREPHPGLELSPSTSPVMPDPTFMNMTRQGVNKATAVSAVAEAYGISMSAVMLVGDGHNDAAAMRQVGYPVAMANAEPEVRQLARREVGHVDEAGLAEALELAMVG